MIISAKNSVFGYELPGIASSGFLTESKLRPCSYLESLINSINTRAWPHAILLWRSSFGLGKNLEGCITVRAYLCLISLSLEPSYSGVPGLIYGFRISSTNPCSFLLVFYRQSSHRKPLISFMLSESLIHGIETVSKTWLFYISVLLLLLPASWIILKDSHLFSLNTLKSMSLSFSSLLTYIPATHWASLRVS